MSISHSSHKIHSFHSSLLIELVSAFFVDLGMISGSGKPKSDALLVVEVREGRGLSRGSGRGPVPTEILNLRILAQSKMPATLPLLDRQALSKLTLRLTLRRLCAELVSL